MTVLLMAARCTAWIELAGFRHSCMSLDDHAGPHSCLVGGREFLWSGR